MIELCALIELILVDEKKSDQQKLREIRLAIIDCQSKHEQVDWLKTRESILG
jgi:hypothetical protein